jgi:hypothetical protein
LSSDQLNPHRGRGRLKLFSAIVGAGVIVGMAAVTVACSAGSATDPTTVPAAPTAPATSVAVPLLTAPTSVGTWRLPGQN